MSKIRADSKHIEILLVLKLFETSQNFNPRIISKLNFVANSLLTEPSPVKFDVK